MTKRNMPDGSEREAPNGYKYIKVDGEWRLKHHIIAEEKLGRKLVKGERVYFVDKDRTNLDPDNIEVRTIANGREQRIEWLQHKIAEYTEELRDLEAQS